MNSEPTLADALADLANDIGVTLERCLMSELANPQEKNAVDVIDDLAVAVRHLGLAITPYAEDCHDATGG